MTNHADLEVQFPSEPPVLTEQAAARLLRILVAISEQESRSRSERAKAAVVRRAA